MLIAISPGDKTIYLQKDTASQRQNSKVYSNLHPLTETFIFEEG